MNDPTTDTVTEGQGFVRLHCFGGKAAPPQVVDGWRQVLAYPPEIRDGLWSLVAPALLEPALPTTRQSFEAFCRDHEMDEKDVIGAVQLCELLLRQASALDLDQQTFGFDLAALSGGDQSAYETLLSAYDNLKAGVRKRLLEESLADHGKVMVGLSWRVDNVGSSDRGTQLNAPVVFLTLRYREGERLDGVTLQLTPDALRELKGFTERIGQ